MLNLAIIFSAAISTLLLDLTQIYDYKSDWKDPLYFYNGYYPCNINSNEDEVKVVITLKWKI